jgi:hypothetical protein
LVVAYPATWAGGIDNVARGRVVLRTGPVGSTSCRTRSRTCQRFPVMRPGGSVAEEACRRPLGPSPAQPWARDFPTNPPVRRLACVRDRFISRACEHRAVAHRSRSETISPLAGHNEGTAHTPELLQSVHAVSMALVWNAQLVKHAGTLVLTIVNHTGRRLRRQRASLGAGALPRSAPSRAGLGSRRPETNVSPKRFRVLDVDKCGRKHQ